MVTQAAAAAAAATEAAAATPHKLRDRERQFHVVSDVAFVLGVHAAAEEAAAAEREQQL